ncbi:hypothetical protein KR51_00021490 [Rubidibacter lacunae KORDI 51-2]|uniref:Uncharacterized protein n=1 Tax=Rubidibacter lacunae KORDI 51-2 TaxID=582515 RepID=U5DNH6_9CHRO|nr:hypothetical protein [Rubidibacter lacunae]ERN41260.1 hypothetical protein KR51_00021490 [Rubidibacter lacunae KORDI 51-2]
MAHTFLLEAGRWTLRGRWQDRSGQFTNMIGKTVIVWSTDRWFTWKTKIVCIDGDLPGSKSGERITEIASQYRGRIDSGQMQYTFMLQQSFLGRLEGEGWIGPEVIVQRYWVLDDRQRRSGFETLHRLNESTYYLTSGLLTGHHLAGTFEATLERRI